MPPRKMVVTGILTGVGKNHRLEPSIDHISMHFEGTKSSGGTAHHESKGIMTAIKELQRFQVAM